MANEIPQPGQVLGKLSAFEREVQRRHRHLLRQTLTRIGFIAVMLILLAVYVIFFIPNGILV